MLKTLRSSFLKTLCAVLALSVVSVSVPKKSEAALILIPIGVATGGAGALTAGIALGGVGTMIGIVALASSERNCAPMCGARAFFGIVAGVLLVLDDNTSVSTQSEAALAERYSFIEDRTVISQLAQTISDKAAVATTDENGAKRVSLSRAELSEILAPSDVMENHADQFEAMVQELQ